MVDVEKLRQAVNTFSFYARPTQANTSAPATVQDINNLVNQTATVLHRFINELANEH